VSNRGAFPIPLPPEMAAGTLSLEQAIDRRRSQRHYSDLPLSLTELGRLLHSAYGVTDSRHRLRAAPSAGALYPLEVYVVVNHVQGLARGIYHYVPDHHALEVVRSGDFQDALASRALGQEVIARASVILAIVAVVERTSKRYKSRAERYVYFEAGHLAQNVCLQATALKLGCCPTGAFLDDEVDQLLGVDGERERAIYLLAVGRVEG